MSKAKTLKLVFYTLGIFICYTFFAILQEKITSVEYTNEKSAEKFTYMFAFVFVQCIINAIFAKILLQTVMKQADDTTRTLYYSSCALAYFLAMVSSNIALKFVSYPVQVIGKSAKPVSIMIFGLLCVRKVCHFTSHFTIFLIDRNFTFLFFRVIQ